MIKRILLVRTDRVGDVVFITPMIREIRKAFPDAFIATLTQPHTKNLLINNPNLNETLTDDLKKESFWKVVRELRRYKFTHGLMMIPTERAAFQMFWAGINTRIGVGHKLYEVITGMKSVSRNNYIPLRHEADYCMDLARKIGVETSDLTLQIYIIEREKSEAQIILSQYGMGNEDYKIFIHTGSLGSAPNWSEDKYLQLIRSILEAFPDKNTKIILTAREMSKEFLSNIHKLGSDRIYNLSEKLLDLRDLIKVIGQTEMLISPSTGPLHIADALGIKCIGLHCHRPMSCAIHQGIINKNSINLEVTDENCKKLCSADQNTCGIEKGITVTEVIESIIKLKG
ncbi:MAG: glycosyltransferase family 9 protein [Ignavibacteriaceae bacterium]